MKFFSILLLALTLIASPAAIGGDQCDGPYEAVADLNVFLWTASGAKFAAGTTDAKGKFSFKIDKERMDLFPASGTLYVTFTARPGSSNILEQRHAVAYERNGNGHFNFTILICNVPLNSTHPQSTAQNKGTFAVSGKSTA